MAALTHASLVSSALTAPSLKLGTSTIRGESSLRLPRSGFKYGPLTHGVSRKRSVVRADTPTSPPPGMSGTEIPLGNITSTAPLEQKGIPVAERIAYVCQDCGYIYDKETPFEEVSDDYNCPVCTAPKTRFTMQNMSVGDALDETKS